MPGLVTNPPAAQAEFVVIFTVTIAPCSNEEDVNTGEFIPVVFPFTFHSYIGEAPGFTGVAVNVTEVPLQTVVADAETLTEGVAVAATLIVITLEVAGFPETQEAFEVSTTLTWSLFASVEDVKADELVPTFKPFIFHWYEGEVPPFEGVAVNVTGVPLHILAAEADTETLTGKAPVELVVIVTWSCIAQPAFVYCTVYVVVAEGVATGLAIFGLESPVAGVHV